MHFGCNSCVLCQIFNIPTKFGEDRSNSNEMATDFRNSRWRPPPSWIAINMHFWCNSCVLCQILNIRIKFGEVRSTCKEMATNFRNSRWRPPPSWIFVNMHFWCNICVLCQILNIPIKFGDDWFNINEMATDFRNSWWRRRPPSWKLLFRLNRHYEKGTPGLLLPIKNLTFVGLSWRLMVVYSWGL